MTFNFNKEQNNPTPYKNIYEPVYIRDLFDKQGVIELNKLGQNLTQEPAQIGVGSAGYVSADIRRSNISWIVPEKCPPELAQFFQNVFIDANKKFFEFDITGTEAYQYTVYEASNLGTYNWHIDTCLLADQDVRKISMSLLLTDPSEFEGGKLLLNNQGNIIVAEEKLGGAVFFPSWMPHCVTPVTKGTRKTLVIWCHGPKFK